MKSSNLRTAGIALVSLVAAASAAPAMARDDGPSVFHARSAEGEVWVDVDLTRLRAQEDYVPVMVAVRNTGSRAISLERSSFEMIAEDGSKVTPPDIRALRTEYGKEAFDETVIKALGASASVPFGTLLDIDHVIPSAFFPSLTRSGGVVINRVDLPPTFWTADLIYFKTPAGLARGRDVTVVVTADGWESPIELHVHV